MTQSDNDFLIIMLDFFFTKLGIGKIEFNKGQSKTIRNRKLYLKKTIGNPNNNNNNIFTA